MPRGSSGRIVIELDPMLKESLYAALDVRGSTLRAWFIQEAERFVEAQGQMNLFVDTHAESFASSARGDTDAA
jgi:hypothetical protein